MESNDLWDFLDPLSEYTDTIAKLGKFLFKNRINKDNNKLYSERTEKYMKVTEYSAGQISRTIESKESTEKTNSPKK